MSVTTSRLLTRVLAAIDAYQEELRTNREDKNKARLEELWLSWLIHKRRVARPRFEPALVGQLRRTLDRHLQNDAGPSVRVRLVDGANQPTRSLLVETTPPGDAVFIAVCTSWQQDFETVGEELSLDRLDAHGASSALALIGWFDCKDWPDGDGRAEVVRSHTQDDVEQTVRHKLDRLPERVARGVIVINATLT